MSEDGTRVLSLRDFDGQTAEQKIKKGVWVPPPKYNTGAYNNELCHVGQTEIELIETRVNRKPIEAAENAF